MPQVCSQCSRVNPEDAVYCFFDGISLAGRAGGPVQAGSQPFPTPFVFPNGSSCRNFDQLAQTCQQHWSAALDLLKQGFLASFFGGMGRVDLAMAAQDAAKFPDADRGLDQLLAKLPSQALQAPKLQVEPTIVNLGQIKIGEDRQAELHLSNLGMRLLYGSIASDAKWLLLGDAPGQPQKVFQFGAESNVPILIRGQHLRAGVKPLEGKLSVDSNGGTAEIIVRADVPPTPFEGGVLQGAISPRQVAEKAKANPAGAAPLFEKGDVAKWFAKNGWTYPVQGPSASGLGAVQQFFEALGLAKAPKVEVNVKEITLAGEPGQVLTSTIEVTTQEKKPVYAHAVSDQPWIDGTKVKIAGRSATIALTVTVPNRPGETLQTKVTVQGNGNQRFQIPFKLTISGNPFTFSPVGLETVDEPAFVPEAVEPAFVPAEAFVPEPAFAPIPTSPPPIPPAPSAAFQAAGPSVSPSQASAPGSPAPAPAKGGARHGLPWWLHGIPAVLLVLLLGGAVIRDFVSKPVQAGDPIDYRARIGVFYDWAFRKDEKANNTMSFGLVGVDPTKPKGSEPQRLTFDHKGSTNSAIVLVDEKPLPFGDFAFGKPADPPVPTGNRGYSFTFRYPAERMQVTQIVEVVPGNPVEVAPNEYMRLLDTCLVRYVIENLDDKAHRVAFRFLLDTYIGTNDGVPFAMPGSDKLVFGGDFDDPKKIPDYLQAIESPDLRNPGTIAQLNLRLGDKYESPSRVVLTKWPGFEWKKKFNLPFEEAAKGQKVAVPEIGNDSAVVMYWEDKTLPRGGKRTVAFSYGLGSVSASSGLGLLNPGSVVVNREFSITAIVQDPKQGQTIAIELPPDFRLADDTPSRQAVPMSEKAPDGRQRPSPVTWRLTAPAAGRFPIGVSTSDGLKTERKVSVSRTPLF